MKIDRVVIRGENVSMLPSMLKGKLTDCHEARFGNTVVLASEAFYFRINSNLLSVILFAFKDDDVCVSEILTGGGAQGLLRSTLGAEQSRNDKIIGWIGECCNSCSWTAEME